MKYTAAIEAGVFYVDLSLLDLGIFWDFERLLCVGVESPAWGLMSTKTLIYVLFY